MKQKDKLFELFQKCFGILPQFIALFEPRGRTCIGRHSPIATWAKTASAYLRPVWHTTAFELLREETAEKDT
jgi:hypothetical protein